MAVCWKPLGLALLALSFSLPAAAQPEEPVGGFVVDARGAIPFLPSDEAVAAPRGTTADRMPGFGLGVDVGVHVYPLRWKAITFGIGANYHVSRGSATPETPEGSSTPAGPTVHSRFQALSPQISFNFGHRMGWSYVSGGMARSTFRAWRADGVEEEGDSTKTINYGGGARWFVNPHLAVSVDLRFYALNPLAPSENTAGLPRKTFAVATAGVSIR